MIFTPHEYQFHCINAILEKPAVGLFLEMGLGKTVITLSAVKELKYYRFEVRRVLVIAPKKVAEATWQAEAKKWEHLKNLKFSAVLGTVKQRVMALNTPADIYIINRENIPWLVDYYRNCWPFDMVIVDESTSFKSHKAKRFKSLSWVRNHISRMVILTGTPVPNGLLDLWSQIYLLDQGERLGKNITTYRSRYFDSDTHGGHFTSYEAKDFAFESAMAKISDICVSMKAKDYITLPDFIVNDIPVQLDPKGRKLYDELERKHLLELDEGDINAGTAAVLTGKLLQLSNGAVYHEDGGYAEIHTAKLDALSETIEQLNGESVLVFYNFRHDLARIKDRLVATKLRVRELKKPQDTEDWNAGKIDILLAHPASAAYGLNLQEGGHHIIWFGLSWSLEQYQQANARLHRQGQHYPVIVHRLAVVDTRDEDVLQALEGKADVQEALMQSLKARIKRAKGLEVTND